MSELSEAVAGATLTRREPGGTAPLPARRGPPGAAPRGGGGGPPGLRAGGPARAAGRGGGGRGCGRAGGDVAEAGLIPRRPLRGTVPRDRAACAALGGALAAFRLAAGRSRADLAAATGYPVTAIRDAEAGRREFPHWLWLSLDDALGARGTVALAHAGQARPAGPARPPPALPDLRAAAGRPRPAQRGPRRTVEARRRD